MRSNRRRCRDRTAAGNTHPGRREAALWVNRTKRPTTPPRPAGSGRARRRRPAAQNRRQIDPVERLVGRADRHRRAGGSHDLRGVRIGGRHEQRRPPEPGKASARLTRPMSATSSLIAELPILRASRDRPRRSTGRPASFRPSRCPLPACRRARSSSSRSESPRRKPFQRGLHELEQREPRQIGGRRRSHRHPQADGPDVARRAGCQPRCE